jgi:tetratricopeptide (TPR) repeat protein
MAIALANFNNFKSHVKCKRFIYISLVLVAIIIGIVVYLLLKSDTTKTTTTTPYSEAVASYQSRLPHLEEEAKDNPKDINAQREYAIALYAVSKFPEAKSQYLKTLKLSPEDSTLHNNLGNICRDLKDYKQAVSYYQESIDLNPKQVNAYVNLANLQIYMLNKVSDGIRTYQKAITALPDNDELRVLLGLAYEQNGEVDKAKTIYQQILSSNPNNTAAKNNLARLNK